MNRAKTFFFYLGTIMLLNIVVSFFVFISNKFIGNLPDILFILIKGAALGYIPFILASIVALQTTSNYEGTSKILWRWKLTFASVYATYGIFQLIVSIYLGMPLFQINEEINMFLIPDHWLYSIPVGTTGLIAGFQVKKDKLEMF